ncbi:MAG: peptidoglycan-binding protein [Acidobacteria bacterium]|nr:peptidoglycan-binding protein [Acidobacteriota bacterium]
MKLQGRRLSNGTQGDDVRLLHRELLLLGFHLIPEDETHPGIFGPHTLVAVREFQQRAGLPVTGVVDEATAHAINEQVAGTPAQATAPAKPGSANSKDGSDQKPKDGPDQKPTDGSDKPKDDQDGQDHGHPEEPWLRVYGAVRDQYGEPLNDVIVQAVDRDLRHEQPLGSVVVKDGRYEIRYHRSQFVKAEKDSADLVMKVLGSEGEEQYRTPIHYNVPDEVEINISLQGGEYQGPSEWEVLTSTFTPLLDDVAPQDLREDDQYQDISFLAGETGTSPLLIGTWIASFRLNAKTTREQTPLAPEVFYGFLRQGEPSIFHDSLLDDLQHPDRVTLIGDKLLRALAEILPDRQRALLEKAIADNLIPARIKVQLQNVLDTLHRIKLRYAADVNLGGGKGTIGQLLEITPIAKQQQAAFLTAFTAHTGPLKDFWQKLEDDKVLPHDAVQQVKLSFELGALTRNHVPLVGALVQGFQSGNLKAKQDLAKYDLDDWQRLFQSPGPDGKPIGVPANIDGDTPEARMQQFATILDQQFERAYPTASFAAKLGRAEVAATPGRAGVAAKPATAPQTSLRFGGDLVLFLNNNPGFQLDRFRVDPYVAQNADALRGIKNKAAVLTDLKSVQRVFKLKPTQPAVTALLSRGIDSAQQIYFMGPGQFARTMADSGINAIEARQIYRKAESTYALALTLFSDYNLAMNGISPFAVPSRALDPKTQAQIATLPNLQTLFGSLDYCECTYCRSVYSPAAYFVDVLRFLGERGTQGSGINAGKNVRQVLLERRPDLGEIELSCENTNTPLPYIDLVNEVLEDVVAPPQPVTLNGAIAADLVAGQIRQSVQAELTAKGVAIGADAQVYAPDSRGQWAIRDAQHAYKVFQAAGALLLLPTRQTLLSAAELRANPEYTNPSAYGKLKQEIFPLDLPFDLWQLQARAYLNHLGVPQPRLFELFQQKAADGVTLSPSSLQIDCAWLGLTETERQIVTGTLPGKQAWDFWGLAATGNNIPNPDNPADPTANVTGTWITVLSSVDVMLNRSGLAYKELLQLLDMLYVNPAGSIFIFDTADPNAANCDTSKFVIRNLTEDALNRMHRFIRLWRKLGCAMWELDLLLPDTNPDAIVDKRITDAVLQDLSRMNRLRQSTGLDWRALYSLYNGIDHNLYVDRSQEGAPAVQTLYQRLFRNKLVDAVASFPPSPGEITGTIADKVPGILAAFRIKEPDLDLILADLGLAKTNNLDATVLSRIYRIAVLAQALSLTVDQFLRLKRLWAQDPFANPDATRKLVELARQVAASDFSVLELDYLLAHRFTPSSGVALEDKTIVTVLQALREGLQKIGDDLRLKTEETKAAYVKSKLGLLPALKKDADQVIALSLVDGTWQGTAANRNALIDTFFAGVLDLAVAKVNLAAIPGGLSPADHQVEVDKRFDYVQPALEAFLLQTQKEAFIRQKIAEVLQLDVPSAGALLTGLHLQGVADTLLQSINDPRLLARLANGTYQFALDETNFPAIFQSLRLLHKDALMTAKLQIKAVELAWWLDGTHATDMGWMHPRDFPIDTTTHVDVQQWVAIQQFFTWKGNLPKSDLTAFELATNILDNRISPTWPRSPPGTPPTSTLSPPGSTGWIRRRASTSSSRSSENLPTWSAWPIAWRHCVAWGSTRRAPCSGPSLSRTAPTPRA